MSMIQMSLVASEHERLHEQFAWQSDAHVWGRREYWTRPVLADGRLIGDCEDYTIELWHRLRDAGIDAHLMKITGCFVPTRAEPHPLTPAHINHIVLALLVPGGVVISDCNSTFLMAPNELPYCNWHWPVDKINGPWEAIHV